MKYVLSVSMIISLLFVSACPQLTKSSAEPKNKPDSAENQNTTLRQNNSDLVTTTTPIPKLTFTPKDTMVWVGSISANDAKREIDNAFNLQNGDIDDSKKYDRIGMITDVDIINCAGYLMSGRAQKRGIYGWEFEVSPESVASDAIEKMKQCDSFSDEKRKKENLLIGNHIFAIAPIDKMRRNVKTSNLDATGVFAQLPHNVQNFLNDTRFDTDYVQRPVKNEISVKNGDNLADIDGDGKVDLISFETICSEDADPEGDGCGFIFMKINGKWKQVGSMQKA